MAQLYQIRELSAIVLSTIQHCLFEFGYESSVQRQRQVDLCAQLQSEEELEGLFSGPRLFLLYDEWMKI